MKIKLTGGVLGNETLRVRCDLKNASNPVEVDYCTGNGWESTQYQAADAKHSKAGLVEIGRALARLAMNA